LRCKSQPPSTCSNQVRNHDQPHPPPIDFLRFYPIAATRDMPPLLSRTYEDSHRKRNSDCGYRPYFLGHPSCFLASLLGHASHVLLYQDTHRTYLPGHPLQRVFTRTVLRQTAIARCNKDCGYRPCFPGTCFLGHSSCLLTSLLIYQDTHRTYLPGHPPHRVFTRTPI